MAEAAWSPAQFPLWGVRQCRRTVIDWRACRNVCECECAYQLILPRNFHSVAATALKPNFFAFGTGSWRKGEGRVAEEGRDEGRKAASGAAGVNCCPSLSVAGSASHVCWGKCVAALATWCGCVGEDGVDVSVKMLCMCR